MLAQERLPLLGLVGDAFHPAVNRFGEFSGVAEPLRRLAGYMQTLDVVSGLS
jgi:hypothetical protein